MVGRPCFGRYAIFRVFLLGVFFGRPIFRFFRFSFFASFFLFPQGCGAQIELTVNRKQIVSDMTVISEGCDVEEYLKVGRAAMVVVGDRPTLLQLVRKVSHDGAGGSSAGGGGSGSGGGSSSGSSRCSGGIAVEVGNCRRRRSPHLAPAR